VHPATSQFSGRDGHHQLERYQSPIMLATTDKVQGLSLHNSVILGVVLGIMVVPEFDLGLSRCCMSWWNIHSSCLAAVTGSVYYTIRHDLAQYNQT